MHDKLPLLSPTLIIHFKQLDKYRYNVYLYITQYNQPLTCCGCVVSHSTIGILITPGLVAAGTRGYTAVRL